MDRPSPNTTVYIKSTVLQPDWSNHTAIILMGYSASLWRKATTPEDVLGLFTRRQGGTSCDKHSLARFENDVSFADLYRPRLN